MQKFLTPFMHHIIFIFNAAVDINYSVSVQFKESKPQSLAYFAVFVHVKIMSQLHIKSDCMLKLYY